jgi:hypothetical protein
MTRMNFLSLTIKLLMVQNLGHMRPMPSFLRIMMTKEEYGLFLGWMAHISNISYMIYLISLFWGKRW